MKRDFLKLAAVITAVALGGGSVWAETGTGAQVSFEAELGTVKVLYHTYRVGPSPTNTDFDFVKQGGQEILYPFGRLTAFLTWGGQHQLRFLYQPLELTTELRFKAPVTIDGVDFADNTPMRLTYSFPFYRLTYVYRFIDGNGSWLAGGAALQLRNASVRFLQLDGAAEKATTSQNLGLVPALALSGRLALGEGVYTAFDITGIYASSAFFNGASFSFEGSLLDASLRLGLPLRDIGDTFLNLRFLGGSANGVSGYTRSEWSVSDSPEAANYLATVCLTLGVTIK